MIQYFKNERGLNATFFHKARNETLSFFFERKNVLEEVKNNKQILEHIKDEYIQKTRF